MENKTRKLRKVSKEEMLSYFSDEDLYKVWLAMGGTESKSMTINSDDLGAKYSSNVTIGSTVVAMADTDFSVYQNSRGEAA